MKRPPPLDPCLWSLGINSGLIKKKRSCWRPCWGPARCPGPDPVLLAASAGSSTRWGAAAQQAQLVVLYLPPPAEDVCTASALLPPALKKYFEKISLLQRKDSLTIVLLWVWVLPHSQRHRTEPNHQREQLWPLFWCKAAHKKKKKKVPCVYSCNTCTIVGKMEEPTADFQVYIFLFPVMSAIHNLHTKKKKKAYEAEHFFLSVYFHLIAEGLGLQQAEIRALPMPCCCVHCTEEGWRGR